MPDFSACLTYLYHLKMLTLLRGRLEAAPADGTVKKPLDPARVPKFENTLAVPPVFAPLSSCEDKGTAYFAVDISEFDEQILPDGFPETTVWGYGGFVSDPDTGEAIYKRCSPGPTFEARVGQKMRVRWVNRLYRPHLFAVDPTLHWANPNGMPMDPPKPWPLFPPGFPKAQWPVPVVTHVHGGANAPDSDGFPEAWFTYDDEQSPEGANRPYTFFNGQESATLWYHDHALGITRLNVCAGLAGFYILRDPRRPFDDPSAHAHTVLPHGKYEIPLVIQDRSFYEDGSLAFNEVGDNPDIHPYWTPEFFGNAIMVNGKVWPRLEVERRVYRFRLLNGSNARFYHLFPSCPVPIYQIGTDGGYLEKPVALKSLLLAPAERADLLVDFSGCAPGTRIFLRNDANAPYPDGDAPDPDTTGQILRFDVQAGPAVRTPLPVWLNTIPRLKADAPARHFTLNEIAAEGGPVAVLLNNQHWSDPVTEFPRVGSTEDWVVANLTMDTHPIHLHLVQFLLESRQPFDAQAYAAACAPPADGHPRPSPEAFATGDPEPPEPNECGWKDTVRMNPGQITRIRVRFAPQNLTCVKAGPGINSYPFDPCAKPGYVWHCHILDHEDNDMMRPFRVIP